tara:strand:+ start:901 stop:2373 length:1473 start_codon:yes stop_codon:yes gene_type:complete
MSELQTAVRAQCEACDATYLVPTAEREYTCKACKGTVRAIAPKGGEAAAEAPALAGTVTCPGCQMINPGGLHFCAECGVSLPESPPGTDSEAGRRLRKEAADALKRATRGFQIVTWTYHVGALAYGIAMLMAVKALARPDVPLTGGVVVVVLTTVLSVLFGMGALHAHFKPFVWTIAIAIATTAATVIHFVGPNPFDLAAFGSAAWALVAYGLLLPTYWFRKQIANHKDLYVLHYSSSETRRSLRGRSAEARHERLMQVLRRAALRTWALSIAMACLVILVSTIGSWLYLTKYRPAPFGPTLAQFESTWNTGDVQSVGNAFDEERRQVLTNSLAGFARGHDWGSKLPPLGEGRVEQTDTSATVVYEVAGLEVTVTWALLGTQWGLDQIDIPVPDYRPTVEQFAAAWATSDPKKVTDFFKPESRAERLSELKNVIDKQGWERLPPILETEVSPIDETQVSAEYKCKRGKLSVRWYYSDGSWYIGTLKLPRG